jgi:TonB family protein
MAQKKHLSPSVFAAFALATTLAMVPTPTHALEVLGEAAILQCVSWVQPVYPQEAIDKKLEGTITVRFIVNEAGVVTSARAVSPKSGFFVEPALLAVRQWRFAPIIEEGRPVAKCVDAKVPFQLSDLKGKPESSLMRTRVMQSLIYPPSTPVTKKTVGDPDYPDSLLSRHLPGVVWVDCSIDAEGHLQGLNIMAATHADFIRPALDAAGKWSFQPAKQGDLGVPATMKGTLEFTVLDVARTDVLGANGVTLTKAPADDPTTEPLDQKPEILMAVDPVYPYDLLLAGTEGEAVADFVIQVDGRVGTVTVKEATRPEFGRALAAALECWWFRPAHKNGSTVRVLATKRQKFNLAEADGTRPAVARLVDRLRNNDTEGMGAKGLDAPLNPRYRQSPTYPAGLLGEKPVGQAEIAFIIDREGRCRLARIVSATHEAFGWAAATAVERWVFDPPKRGGQPVDVRVSIPFKFDLPK